MATIRRHMLALAALGLAALGGPGCYSITVGVAGYERHGVWLPERGERYRPSERITVGELEMSFDTELGVYRIADHPGHFFLAMRYYRLSGSRWEAAPSLGGPWAALPETSVPPGLLRAAVDGTLLGDRAG